MMVTHAQAERRVNLGFVIHSAVYGSVVTGLVTMNFLRHPDKPWSLWVAAGWGMGVALHGVLVFLVPNARERAIRKIVARMERRAAAPSNSGGRGSA